METIEDILDVKNNPDAQNWDKDKYNILINVINLVVKEHDKELISIFREREKLIIEHLDGGIVGNQAYFEGKMAMIVEVIEFMEQQS